MAFEKRTAFKDDELVSWKDDELVSWKDDESGVGYKSQVWEVNGYHK
jgi:hypothetical protein